MAATTGGINIGDAVLTFLADTTQLDQAVARINDETAAKLQPAGNSVANLGKGFDALGASATSAGAKSAAGLKDVGQVSDNVKDKIKELQKELPNTAVQFQAIGSKARGPLREAAAEVGLLGEATGVTLPRHVRTFLASLSGVSEVLEAAFAATAVLFLIEAVISAGEKIKEFAEKPRKIEEAWRDVGDATASASRTMTQSLDAAQAKIIGLTQGPLAEMDFQIKHLGSDAEQVAGLVGKMGDALVKALAQQDTSKFNLFSFFKDNSRDVTEQATRFVSQLQSTLLQLGNQGGLVALKSQLGDVEVEIKKTAKEFEEDSAKIGTALDIIEGRPAQASADIFKTRLDSLNKYKASLLDLQNLVQQGIEKDAADKQIALLEKRREAGDLAAAQAKRNLDAELAGIEQRKAADHLALASGQKDAADFAVSQLNATTAATAAHEKYLANLITIYRRSGDVVKAQSVTQELATAQTLDGAKQTEALAAAVQKYHEANLKIVKDWQDLQNNSVAKNFEEAQKAAQRLTIEEIKLGEAQQKLQQTKNTVDFTAQESAIQKLADFGVISEENKARRLAQLYQIEERQAIESLKTLLAQEKSAVESAQTKLDAGKTNPVLSDAQVLELQTNLDRMKILYTHTEAEIIKTQADFDQKRLALDQGYFSQSVALAIAAGKEDLAAGLQVTKGYIDQIDAEIRLAAARNQDTTALKAQRATLVGSLNGLEAEARGLHDVATGAETAGAKFALFIANFQKGNTLTNLFNKDLNSTSEGMRTFGSIASTVASEFGSAWQSAIAGAILGQESFGTAMRRATADTAAQIAAQSLLYGAFYLAQGIADAFWNPPRAAADFASAAEFFALGGAAAGIAIGLNPGKQSAATGSGSGTGSAAAASPAQTPQQQPVSVVNTPRLYAGGLFTKSTLMIGDAASGGDSRKGEGVIPLDDDRAMDAIAGEIAKRMPANGGGDTHIHVKGDMIDYAHAMKKMSRQARKGNGRLAANNSFRVTRRG